MNLRSTIDFLLYDWLQAELLNQRPRFADHSRETFDAVFDTCERIARENTRRSIAWLIRKNHTLMVKKSSCRRPRMMRKKLMPNQAC